MKLVAAKCPNCGAAIDVDKDSDSTKCEFCKSKIIVEDAIAKYKIELSGEVEVKNLPKEDNLMVLADMHFKDQEYDEAYNHYAKVCELDPNNAKAILRKGLCKSYSVEYPKFDIVSAMNAMKNAYNLLKSDIEKNADDINRYVSECNNVIVIKAMKIDHYSASHYAQGVSEAQLRTAQLMACLNNQDYLYNLIIKNEGLELALINSMFRTIDYILSGKEYQEGISAATGRPATYFLPVPKKDKKDLLNFKNRYMVRYNYIMKQRGQ